MKNYGRSIWQALPPPASLITPPVLPPSATDMLQGQDIVCAASANWDSLWVNAQHMMYRLAVTNRVLYVESTGLRAPAAGNNADRSKVLTRLRHVGRAWRQPCPDRPLYVQSPLVLPWYQVDEFCEINRLLLAAQVKRSMRALGMRRPLLWLFLPTAVGLLGALDEICSVYFCVDDYQANPRVPAPAIQRMEHEMLRKVDEVFVTSLPLYNDKRHHHAHCHYAPNVADVAAFHYEAAAGQTPPPVMQRLPRPILGFAGNIAGYKIDMGLLEFVARAHPEWSIVLIGPVGTGDPDTAIAGLQALSNVHWLGERNVQDLPDYVRAFDVGMIPYADNAVTRAAFPMKFFEYLAAGIPVIATALPALEEYADRPELCALTHSKQEFVRALEHYVNRPNDPAARLARWQAAREHSWESRLELVSNVLQARLSGQASHT